jgi:hypothetical protein
VTGVVIQRTRELRVRSDLGGLDLAFGLLVDPEIGDIVRGYAAFGQVRMIVLQRLERFSQAAPSGGIASDMCAFSAAGFLSR